MLTPSTKANTNLTEGVGVVRGRMTQEWADGHEYAGIDEYDSYYYSPEAGRCQNPRNGHYPIYHRYVLRHIESGEVVEIGTHCHQRYRKLRGLSTEPWWAELEKARELAARERPGRRLSASEDRKIKREAYKKWLLKQEKLDAIALPLILQPLENFRTVDEAWKWAMEQGGYCDGTFTKTRNTIYCRKCHRYYEADFKEKFCLDCGSWLKLITVEGKTFWKIYVNPHYKGEYLTS